MALTEFDFAVINASEEMGLESAEVYKMVDRVLGERRRGRWDLTQDELLEALNRVIWLANIHVNPDLPV